MYSQCVKIWVVLWPGLQRTMMMAGVRTREAGGAAFASAAGVWATERSTRARHTIKHEQNTAMSLALNFIGMLIRSLGRDYCLSVAVNATVLPIGPAGVETGTSTSSRCSPPEPQGMDGTNVCAVGPRAIPSMAMACEADASRRETVRFTWEDEFPGQSTFNANRVETTNDPEFFWLVSPSS